MTQSNIILDVCHNGTKKFQISLNPTLAQCYNKSYNVTKPIKEHNHKETWRRMNVVIHLNISIIQHEHATISPSTLTVNENCNLTWSSEMLQWDENIKECVKYNKTINKNSKYKCENLCDTHVLLAITYNILKNFGTVTI